MIKIIAVDTGNAGVKGSICRLLDLLIYFDLAVELGLLYCRFLDTTSSELELI